MEQIWTRRNITDNHKLKYTVELYESLGYDVKVEDYTPDYEDVECNTCLLESPKKFKVIYTRGSPSNA